MKKLFILSIVFATFILASQGQTSKRLVAHSYYENGNLMDSNHYYYSNGRGSIHPSLSSYADTYIPDGIDEQSILSDSSVRWHRMFAAQPLDVSKKSYTYNAAN